MRRRITILVGILILINTSCAFYTPEERKACSQLVTKTTSFVHMMSGTVYVLHGAEQDILGSNLGTIRRNCMFLEKDDKGNVHMQCGSMYDVDPVCVEKRRNN